MSLEFPRDAAEASAFWQRRFYDFNVYSRKKVKEKLEYMHANPVTRKLVTHPKDWPWSSWSYYVKEEGLIRVDMDYQGKDEDTGEKRKQSQRPHP